MSHVLPAVKIIIAVRVRAARPATHAPQYLPATDESEAAKTKPRMATALLPTTCHERSLYLPEVIEIAIEMAPATRYCAIQ